MIRNTIKENTQKMFDKIEETTQPVVNPLFKTARSLLLASIGAVALSREEIESLVNRLVEKGELTEKDGRKLVEDLVERTKEMGQSRVKQTGERFTQATGKTEEALTKRIESVLNAMNIPSKVDIEQLTRKIDALSRKVSALDKKIAQDSPKVSVKKTPTKKAA